MHKTKQSPRLIAEISVNEGIAIALKVRDGRGDMKASRTMIEALSPLKGKWNI